MIKKAVSKNDHIGNMDRHRFTSYGNYVYCINVLLLHVSYRTRG